MLSGREKTAHDRIGELSALAALGQVTAEEHQELKAHLEACAGCRQQYGDFSKILLEHLPLGYSYGEDHSLVDETVPQGISADVSQDGRLREFPYRKQSGADIEHRPNWLEGIWQWPPSIRLYMYGGILFLLVGGGVLVPPAYKHVKLDHLRVERLANLENENVRFRSQVLQLSNRPTDDGAAEKSSIPADANAEKKNLAADYSKLVARNRNLESQLKIATDELLTLKDQANSGTDREGVLSVRLSETQATLSKLKDELGSEREVRSHDAATIRKQQERLQQIEEQLTATTDSVERDKRLLAADRDIRDLMGARRLRIIDIFDADSKGRTRKPFGRVFFTEDRSLIFYAFDLGNQRPSMQAASYQAWGYEGTYQHGVRSLGIFYQDDQKSNRWVLTFDDPAVLAEIDSVFVTMEPPGGSNKPTGSMLLSAYLKTNLNHP